MTANFATFGDKQASKLPRPPAQLPSTKPATDVLNYLFLIVVLAGIGIFVYRTFSNGTSAAPAAPLPIPDSGDWLMDWQECIPGIGVGA
jgi:hypothetical protein